ncbi:hypothetical protein PQ469_07985 [Mucilaginibacter sp. KACC 22773]|uniref:hypothetical protein n=1 Tax=Mucilaginibacter sp. KACC 22773 TaxID=3025671 RepID=UPI0023664E10|nr:hypothetical protein [Mucilaginibacter sp. KACC 22773]WDF79944.1 hypothetical protein PQ469_07985 [Mucilaginibacter sp. KACC 22773]
MTIGSLIYTILPIFGMIIILLCMAMYRWGNQAKLIEKQHFGGYGLQLDISVITLFILIAVLSIAVSVFFYYKSTDSKLTAYETMIKRMQLDSINTKQNTYETITILKSNFFCYRFKLKDLPNGMPPEVSSLKFTFYKNYNDIQNGVELPVKPSGQGYKVTFYYTNEDFQDAYPKVVLEDTKTKKRWVSPTFNPITPTVELIPEN